MNDSNDLLNDVAAKANEYLLPDDPTQLRLDEDKLIQMATSSWVDIATEQTPTRPIPDEVKTYLRDVIHDVVKAIATKHREGAVVTLTFASQQLINYMIISLGWTNLVPYAIPLEILAAIIYTKVLKNISKNL